MRLSSQNTGEMKALIERQEMALIRLRNELHIAQEWSARVIAGRDQDTAEITALRAENERLRAALEKINVGEGWAALIARAALEEKP